MKRMLLLGATLSAMGFPSCFPGELIEVDANCPDFSVEIAPDHCYEMPLDPCSDSGGHAWDPYAYFALDQPLDHVWTEAFRDDTSINRRICAGPITLAPTRVAFTIARVGHDVPYGTGFVTITVREPIPLHIEASPAIVDVYDRVTLTPVSSGGTPPFTYRWSPADLFSDPSDRIQSVGVDKTTDVEVELTDAAGARRTAALTIPVRLVLVAEADPPALAGGEWTTLRATASGGDLEYAYQWWWRDFRLPEGSEVTVRPSATTTYTVVVTDRHGQTATANVDVTVQQAPPLVASFVFRQPSNTGVPFDITLDASASTGNIVSYEWDLSWVPGSIDLTAGPIAIYTRTQESLRGTITLRVRDADGNVATSSRPYP